MANVEVFCGHADKQTGQKLYAPDLSMRDGGGRWHKEKKNKVINPGNNHLIFFLQISTTNNVA